MARNGPTDHLIDYSRTVVCTDGCHRSALSPLGIPSPRCLVHRTRTVPSPRTKHIRHGPMEFRYLKVARKLVNFISSLLFCPLFHHFSIQYYHIACYQPNPISFNFIQHASRPTRDSTPGSKEPQGRRRRQGGGQRFCPGCQDSSQPWSR